MIFRLCLPALLFIPAFLEAGALTSTTLSASESPALLGQPVTLTALVQPSGVTGSVSFFSGVQFLGVAPVSSGIASFNTALLPAGPNTLTARFEANISYASSTSPSLAFTVAVAPGAGFPGGVINQTGFTPAAVATADFNNDGIADLVTANSGAGTVSILLGNGDGSFQPMPDVAAGLGPVAVVVADFNSDGQPDLAVVNSEDPSVAILLGNGDGTFQPPQVLTLGSEPVSAALGDWNADGFADLAIIDAVDNTLTVLLGDGTGNFTLLNPLSLGFTPAQIAVADFNSDGKIDLAIAGVSPDGVAVLLGNGSGAFTLEAILGAGTAPSSVIAADFNGDGKVDLAVGDLGDSNSLSGGGIELLLGNGNGTFRTPLLSASGQNIFAMALGDFNGDGVPDLGILNADGFSTYLGNGDGTLGSPQSYSAGASPSGLAIGSFDGAGLAEVAVVNQNENEIDVLAAQPGTCLYTLSPASLLYDASPANGIATLQASATGCSWTVASDFWISTQPSSGLGSASLSYQIQSNSTGYDRSGSLAAGGQVLAISQRFTVQQFTDVPPTGYNFDGVNALKDQGITSGCGPTSYCPTEPVTRAQMAVFIVRGVYGGDNFTSSPNPYFTDVPTNAFGFRWIQKLYELGVTAGCGFEIYCPNSFVTRAQMAVFVIRARFGATVSFYSPPTAYFTDVPVGAFGFAWVQRMRFDGITAGCNLTLYCPNSSVTRGDMAIFIMRGLFNDLYPQGTPTLVSVSPSVLVRGQPATFNFTGVSTGFAQGQTTLTSDPNITVTNIQVSSPTTFSADLSAAGSTPVQPVGLVAITGAEQDVLPNGITVQ